MSWEAISAIGEIVGAIAVVATLFYIAIQIRHSIRVAESDAFDRASQSFKDSQSASLDPALGELFYAERTATTHSMR